jgi:hypothetical protein
MGYRGPGQTKTFMETLLQKYRRYMGDTKLKLHIEVKDYLCNE